MLTFYQGVQCSCAFLHHTPMYSLCARPAWEHAAMAVCLCVFVTNWAWVPCFRSADAGVMAHMDGDEARLPVPMDQLQQQWQSDRTRWKQQRTERVCLIGAAPKHGTDAAYCLCLLLLPSAVMPWLPWQGWALGRRHDRLTCLRRMWP